MKLKSYLTLTTIATASSIVIVVTIAIFYLLQNTYTEGLQARGLELARVVAHDPTVIHAVTLQNTQVTPQALNPYIENIRSHTDASYIVVVDKQAIRLSHPDHDRIGKPFIGEDILPTLRDGTEYSNVSEGSLGKAIRNFTPIRSEGEIIGAVSIGYLSEKTSDILLEQFSHLATLIGLVYLLGISIASTFLLKMKRTFLDYEPEFIINKFREHEMVLNSIHDAIIAVDNNMNITTINKSAIQKLSMGGGNHYDYLNHPLSRYSIPLSHLVLNQKNHLHQSEFNIGKHQYKADIYPLTSNKGLKGQVIVFFANIEQNELEREVIYLKNYAELLRSKTHEYSNKLNVISGMLQSKKHSEAIDFIQLETDCYQSIIHNIVLLINNSVIAGLLLAKFNKASDIGVKFVIDEDSHLSNYSKNTSEKLVTILGNLIDNALLAAWQNRENQTPTVHLYLSDRSHHVIFEIQDSGAGISQQITDHILEFGVTSKMDAEQSGIGLYLVKQWVDYFHGSIEWERTEDNTTIFSVYLDKNKVTDHE
ncbi:ATP-binding protein [Vibrio cincinnatiensis]|jgi:two-component system CitB family sensor kinase|uniref:ATP-binding protein n=1 Tax=Vibrio cincinnatiensis TaxID=675 RepID=UPI0013022FDF|nr:sensor histidine kinase [Vibrio cincinnatiensis]